MKKFLVFMTLFLAFICPTFVKAQDVNFDIEAVNIDVGLNDRGDAYFQQVYRYDVDYMNGAILKLDANKLPVLEYQVGVLDNQGRKQYFELSDSEAPQTYKTYQEDDIQVFKLFYPAENQVLHFFLDYQIQGLVTNYKDTAEFNWKILGSGVEESLDVIGTIYLPGPLEEGEELRVWGHGAPQGQVQPIKEEDQAMIKVDVPNNPSNTFVEVYSLFPTRLTKNNPNLVDKEVLEEKIAAEDARVLADKQRLERNKTIGSVLMIGSSLFAPIPILFGLKKYKQARAKHLPNPAHVPDHIYSPPKERKPAIVASTFVRDGLGSSSTDLTVTLLDLARRGYLDLDEVKAGFMGSSVIINRTDKPESELEDFEAKALAYVTHPLGKPFNLKDMDKFMKANVVYKENQIDRIEAFKDRIEEETEAILADSKQAAKPVTTWSILAFLGTIFAIVTGAVSGGILGNHSNYFWYIFATGLVISLILLFILGYKTITGPVATYEHDKERREWKAFGKMLKDIGQMDMREIASLALWEEYLIYAVAFGHGKKVIKAMNQHFTMDELEQGHLPYLIYSNNGAFVDTMDQSVSKSVSSSSFGSSGYAGDNIGGSGGGFSSGSSGGGGGGGGAGGF